MSSSHRNKPEANREQAAAGETQDSGRFWETASRCPGVLLEKSEHTGHRPQSPGRAAFLQDPLPPPGLQDRDFQGTPGTPTSQRVSFNPPSRLKAGEGPQPHSGPLRAKGKASLGLGGHSHSHSQGTSSVWRCEQEPSGGWSWAGTERPSEGPSMPRTPAAKAGMGSRTHREQRGQGQGASQRGQARHCSDRSGPRGRRLAGGSRNPGPGAPRATPGNTEPGGAAAGRPSGSALPPAVALGRTGNLSDLRFQLLSHEACEEPDKTRDTQKRGGGHPAEPGLPAAHGSPSPASPASPA